MRIHGEAFEDKQRTPMTGDIPAGLAYRGTRAE